MGDSDSETSYEGAPNIVLSSEIGVCPELPDSEVKIKNRLEPGKMYLVDFETQRIVPDDEIKEQVASMQE
jgi:hypothetical protein